MNIILMINNTILQFIEYIYSISTISTLHQYMIKPVQIKLLELVDFFNISPLKPAVLYFRGGYHLHMVHSPGAW